MHLVHGIIKSLSIDAQGNPPLTFNSSEAPETSVKLLLDNIDFNSGFFAMWFLPHQFFIYSFLYFAF